MIAPIEIKTLSTASDLAEARRTFDLSSIFGPVPDMPEPAPEGTTLLPAGSFAAVITLKSLFGAGEEIEFGTLRAEMKIAFDWASGWSNEGVLAMNSRVRFVSETAAAADAMSPEEDVSLDAMVVRENPVVRLIVVPFQPADPGQEGRKCCITVEEALGNMAEARFGPQGRERHMEALVASWSEFLAGEARGEDGTPYRLEPLLSAIDAHVASMAAWAGKARPD